MTVRRHFFIMARIISTMSIISFLNRFIFSPLLCSVAAVCGIYYFVKLRFYSPAAVYRIFKRCARSGEGSGISPFSSLSVALAGTLGVGNISGVAVAISLGGAGAVFWMLVSAVFGVSLKYSEAYLSVKYRRGIRGGAPYYIEKLTGKIPAVCYAVLCIAMSLTSGSFVQMNAASTALNIAYGVPKIVCGAAFAVLCAVIVFGGVKRVSSFTAAAMPVFCLLFAAISLTAVFMRIELLPSAVCRIISGAFGFRAAAGGFAGAVFSSALRHGIAKGVFSHEAGCGTSAFSHAASSSSDPVGQGGLGIAEVLFDTVFFGLLTAFVILLCPVGDISGCYDGTYLSVRSYSFYFGGAAVHVITWLIVFFAVGTVVCWAYYGCEAVAYLGGGRILRGLYLALYCLSLVIGSVAAPSFIWESSDMLSSLLLVINCTALMKGRGAIRNK